MSIKAVRTWLGTRACMGIAVGLTLAATLRAQVPQPSATSVRGEWAAVDRIMGRDGKVLSGGVHRYSFPRGDLRVQVHGVPVKPALALGSWVAFEGPVDNAMAMGDIVLTEREVARVLVTLQQAGVQPTALHNHLLGESPRVMYLHIQAHGEPARIAEAVRSALALTGTPPATPSAGQSKEAFPIDTEQLRATLGYGGSENGGVYQVSVARAETVHADGMEVPPSMGVATAINFQPTGGHKTAITGDFVLTANEVAPVIQALRGGGIDVTAVHSHMLTEEPRLFFLHFWANADAIALARTLRGALDRMNVKKGSKGAGP